MFNLKLMRSGTTALWLGHLSTAAYVVAGVAAAVSLSYLCYIVAVPGAGKKLIGDLHDKKEEVEEEGDEAEDPSADESNVVKVDKDKVKGTSEGGKGKTNEKTAAEKTRRRRRRDVSNTGKVIHHFLIIKNPNSFQQLKLFRMHCQIMKVPGNFKYFPWIFLNVN